MEEEDESSKTIKSADSEFIKFVDPKLVDQVAEDQLSLSSGSEREVDFWITYDEKFQDKTSFRFDETIIDDDIKNKIHKLTCLDLENNQAMEMNLKYCYSELVRAYEKINTLQIIITSLNKELTKSKANTKQANNYINTLLLAGKQKTKNEGMAAKIKFQSQYHLRLEQIQSKFLHESDFLRKEFYRQRGLFLCKDKLVNKLVRIIVEQELVIEVLKHELKRDVTLHRMKSFDNVFTVHREFEEELKISSLTRPKTSDPQLKKLQRENILLMHELKSMKAIVDITVRDTTRAHQEIVQLRNNIK